MSTSTSPTAQIASEWEPPLWPITVATYSEMIRAGLIGEDDPVHLWEGRLASLTAPRRPHSVSVLRLSDAVRERLPEEMHVETEQPLALRLRHSVPQPDLMILRGQARDYLSGFPTTADALWIAEVADTSLAKDRNLAPIYAAEGVGVYWIVNLPDRCVEVHEAPTGGAYRRVTVYGMEESVPLRLDDRDLGLIAVRDILP